MITMVNRIRDRSQALQSQIYAVYFAARDPRTPWLAKALVFLVVAYTLSPIDLIPDFIPVLGYLDDLIIVPAGITLALRLIPRNVMAESRKKAGGQSPHGIVKSIGAGIIVIIWILSIIVLASFIPKFIRKTP